MALAASCWSADPADSAILMGQLACVPAFTSAAVSAKERSRRLRKKQSKEEKKVSFAAYACCITLTQALSNLLRN